jgi:8-oxo-dGTP pyrophosphatase MutT (NUDIX family)
LDRTADLRRRLEGHRAVDRRERAHRAAFEALLRDRGDPFDRGRFDPGHVTASGYVLSPDLSAVLLVHHRTLERWLQPGGHVEPSDADVETAARREVREETGLRALDRVGPDDTPFDLDVHEIPARPGQPAHRHFDVRFLFVARDAAVRGGSDVRDVAWVPREAFATRGDEAAFRRVAVKIERRVRDGACRAGSAHPRPGSENSSNGAS